MDLHAHQSRASVSQAGDVWWLSNRCHPSQARGTRQQAIDPIQAVGGSNPASSCGWLVPISSGGAIDIAQV